MRADVLGVIRVINDLHTTDGNGELAAEVLLDGAQAGGGLFEALGFIGKLGAEYDHAGDGTQDENAHSHAHENFHQSHGSGGKRADGSGQGSVHASARIVVMLLE